MAMVGAGNTHAEEEDEKGGGGRNRGRTVSGGALFATLVERASERARALSGRSALLGRDTFR